ncbi:MAG: DNA mismatch repair endonuclease MutL, partial [Candidatus Tectomicrobia bacterium]|nr:DNA mismatch repair endonuclease MutL [Candidatus Tectomicrobia bacterium]
MTGRIQRLDTATASRIAAGEVIERPTSVVKELIDNALDAGSTRIDIELLNGGRRLIQVTDNGSGIHADDVALALQRFTTSKIRHLDDLSLLTTLGFRGEALPSIAAVADVEISTRTAEQSAGVLVQSVTGVVQPAQALGCPVGTRVRVQRLFQHIPVRLRALTSVAREVQLLQELVGHYALAHPQVTFQVQHDGRRLLLAPASTDTRQRLAVVFGQELARQMLPVFWESLDIHMQGAVSPGTLNRATRQRQYCWVNGRPVRSPLVSAALEKADGALLPPGRHPIVALGITLGPDSLDVNIHPRKTEIKFLQERAIYAGVQEAVERAVQHLAPASLPWEEAVGAIAWPAASLSGLHVSEPAASYTSHPPDATSWRALGQIGNTFLVASGVQGLLVLDQHAAHESLLYAQLLTPGQESVELDDVFPVTLTAVQYQAVLRLQPGLAALGFHLEPFGKETILVRAVPAILHPRLR